MILPTVKKQQSILKRKTKRLSDEIEMDTVNNLVYPLSHPHQQGKGR